MGKKAKKSSKAGKKSPAKSIKVKSIKAKSIKIGPEPVEVVAAPEPASAGSGVEHG